MVSDEPHKVDVGHVCTSAVNHEADELEEIAQSSTSNSWWVAILLRGMTCQDACLDCIRSQDRQSRV